MGNEADVANYTASLPVRETTQALYTYDIIETLEPVRASINNLCLEGIEQIALVAIRLQFDPDARHDLVIRSATHLLDNLRLLVRKTDQVFLHTQTMYFVLRAANQQGGEIVQTRLCEALLWRVHNMNEPELQRPRNVDIGHAGYVEEGSVEATIETSCAWQLHYEWHPEKSRKASRQSQAEQMPIADPLDIELPVLARKLGIPYLSLLPRKLPINLQRLVKPSLAQELRCFPIGRERDTLTVAMLDPRDLDALNRLRAETGLHIFPVLAHPEALQTALEQLI
ncbi:MAG TPA: hypothetical protein VGT44_05420 [Ktedonobacteraceae bacterium]|nr:hypothetical protein [Ktedonobacteraceae bacterium]